MNKNFYFPNHNPYLLWAKEIRFFLPYKFYPQTAIQRAARCERIRATYNNVKPYRVEDLEQAAVTMQTNQNPCLLWAKKIRLTTAFRRWILTRVVRQYGPHWIITEAGPWLKSKKFTP